MKRIPVSVRMMVFGLLWTIVGAANSWAAISAIAGVIVMIGFVWFCLMWDKLYISLVKAKSYDKRVRRNEERQKDQDAHRDMMDKTNSRRLNALEKRSSQTIKGYIRKSGEIINFERKEA